MRKGVLYCLYWLLMLGTFMAFVPAAAEAASSSTPATPLVLFHLSHLHRSRFSGRRTTRRVGQSRCDSGEIEANPRFGVTVTTTLASFTFTKGT